jgi:hypothetical protein
VSRTATAPDARFCSRGRRYVASVAAVFDLNQHATYVHWHFIQISVANIVVIVLMAVVFLAAILVPFPGRRTGGRAR